MKTSQLKFNNNGIEDNHCNYFTSLSLKPQRKSKFVLKLNRNDKHNSLFNTDSSQPLSPPANDMIHFFHPSKLNKRIDYRSNTNSADIKNNNSSNPNSHTHTDSPNYKYFHQTKSLHFASNTIAKKEITMLKSKEANGQLIEALVNQTIDFTVIPNSTLFGKSIFDTHPNTGTGTNCNHYTKKGSERWHKAKTMRPMYSTILDKDKSNERIMKTESSINSINKPESNVAFTYKSGSTKTLKGKKSNQSKQLKESEVKDDLHKKDSNDIHNHNQPPPNNDSFISNTMNENNNEGIPNYQINTHRLRLTHHLSPKDIDNHLSNKTKIEFTPILKVETNLKENTPTSPNNNNNNDDSPNNPLSISRCIEKKDTIFSTDSYLISSSSKAITTPNTKPTHNKANSSELIDDIPEVYLQENIKPTQVYYSQPIYTLNDIWYKNNTDKDSNVIERFNVFIGKYMVKSDSFSMSNDNDNANWNSIRTDNSNGNSNNEDNKINKDYDEIANIKQQIQNIHHYYTNQISKIQYEIKKKEEKRIRMDESLMSRASSNSLPLFSKQDKIRLIMEKLDTLDASLSQKEKNYKITVNALLNQLQELRAKENEASAIDNANANATAALIKEATDFLNDDANLFKLRRKEMGNYSQPKDSIALPQDNRKTNISLMTELEKFKKEEASYKFEIPLKYQNMQMAKCIKEQAIKGKLVRFYDNSVIDIVDKKKTIRRLFPDGYEIWYYSNKDIQLKLSNGRLYFFYNKNRSYEFRCLNENFTVYKFPSGQYEKHYFDNAASIKFTDGSYRITRLNGEELMQFADGTVHYSDPKSKSKQIKSSQYHSVVNNE